MAEDLATHDLSAYIVNLGGIPLEGGYAVGEAIAISKPVPDYEEEEGEDGSPTRVRTNSNNYLVTLAFGTGSKSNTILGEMREVDQNLPNGVAMPFFLENTQGTTKLISAKAYIKGPPTDVTIGRASPAKQWVIAVTNAKYIP